MHCRFCHSTELNTQVMNLSFGDITDAVLAANEKMQLPNDKPLLVSFMGLGEPVMNLWNMVDAMLEIRAAYPKNQVRFAFATIMPKIRTTEFFILAQQIKQAALNVKVHLSLHAPFDSVRQQLIPQAGPVVESIIALEWYREHTGNPVEIHYALIEGVNDRPLDAVRLAHWLEGRTIPVKILSFNPKEGEPFQPSPIPVRVSFMEALERDGVTVEFYAPNGRDIGTSCGMFLKERYACTSA
jgi:23S rRNA (adenine2503-C2)-methyltransferase